MTDLLTHVLIAFAVGQLVASVYPWVTRSYRTAILTGALIPEMVKIGLIIPGATMTTLLGMKFSWNPLASIYGVTISILIGTLIVVPDARRRIFLTLAVGVLTHIVLDIFVVQPAPTIGFLLWPVPEVEVRLLNIDLYRSTDWWLPFPGAAIAFVMWYFTDVATEESVHNDDDNMI
jgi:hypothetical protein